MHTPIDYHQRYVKTCQQQREYLEQLEGRIQRLRFALVIITVVLGLVAVI